MGIGKLGVLISSDYGWVELVIGVDREAWPSYHRGARAKPPFRHCIVELVSSMHAVTLQAGQHQKNKRSHPPGRHTPCGSSRNIDGRGA